MFRHIAAFEFRFHLRSPVFWVTALIFALLTFGSVASDNIQIGSVGNVKVNSPYAIATTLQIMSVFAMFIMAAFVASAVVRDDETRFGPIVHATPVSRFDYLFGRFTGAFAAGCLAFAGVPLAMLIGSFMPWLDPETVGPFRLDDYLYVYVLLCLPTLFVTGAFCFALATLTRSMLSTYVGIVALLMVFLVTSAYFDRPEYEQTMALIEPFGIGAVGYVTKYWTATERNTQLPAIAGLILWNRLIWFGAAFALLALAWTGYRTGTKTARRPRKQPTEVTESRAPERAGPLPMPQPDKAAWTQLFALARFDMAAVFRSPVFFVLLGIGFINSIGALWSADESYGNTIYPVTRVMIGTLNGAFTFIPLIIAIFYAGELVWRDRDRRVHEIVDATPAPDWTFVLPKILAITLVLLATLLAGTAAAIVTQLLKGYTHIEVEKYLLWYALPSTVDLALTAILAVFIQVLVPHKVAGWLVMMLVIVAQIVLARLGFEHNLYHYGGGPETPLSDINGQGNFAAYRAWFRAYWSACAVLLAVLAYALWRRGNVPPILKRLRVLPRRLTGVPGVIAGAAVIAMAVLGGYIFYNTNVLNDYRTALGSEKWQADLEKTLLPFEKILQPRITDVVLNVEIFPHDKRVVTSGRYTIENRTSAPLQEIHLRWDREAHMAQLEVPGGKIKREFPRFNYRIYSLERPLAPGERSEIRFQTVREQRGFRNSGNEQRIVRNGTFLNNFEITPFIGMGRDNLLEDRAKRRKHGLPPEMRVARLEEEGARAHHYLRRDSDWVNADITISTMQGQLPIAPGYKMSDEVVNGRRVIRYKTDAPIMHFFSLQSANYAQRQDRWRDVDLTVYYHPGHAYNVDRMLKAMKASLDYATTHFSPFQFKQLRILEFPGYERFAQAFANTVPYSESIGFIGNYKDPEKIDMVTYVTAHEIGHQWWAHQIIGGEMQGMTLLSETLAQYTALMVMERLYGPDQIRKFLRYELDSYLRDRGSEVIEELPLMRVENQPYIHYRKGSLAMYLLKDTVGEEKVNRALQELLREYAFKAAPYPTSRDLLRHLRAAAGPEHDQLITDLFEKITLYDVKVTAARKQKRADGKWDIALDVEARKLYADGEGKETAVDLSELFDVGVFTAEPGKKDFDSQDVVTFERQPIRSGRQTLRITTTREPTYAGVDPYNKRVDRNSEDNVRAITTT